MENNRIRDGKRRIRNTAFQAIIFAPEWQVRVGWRLLRAGHNTRAGPGSQCSAARCAHHHAVPAHHRLSRAQHGGTDHG